MEWSKVVVGLTLGQARNFYLRVQKNQHGSPSQGNSNL